MTGPLEVWHFTAEKHTLRDGKRFKLGKPLPAIVGEVKACRNGYHGSPSVLDALGYAYGTHLYRRTLSGVIVPHGEPIDKYAASEAVATAYCDATPVLRIFARQCALDVIHLWKAPQVKRGALDSEYRGGRTYPRRPASCATRGGCAVRCPSCGHEAEALWEQRGRTVCPACSNGFEDNARPGLAPEVAAYFAGRWALEGIVPR